MQSLFHNRSDAGQQLARLLAHYANSPTALVLGLPRGGVPVAFEVASALHLPMDLFLVRKLGAPVQPELALGAIASGGVLVRNERAIRIVGISEAALEKVAARERAELERRELLYRDDRPLPDLQGRTVILVDDGLATGSTMRAAARAVRQLGAARVVIAVPVGAPDTRAALASEADEIIVAQTPADFYAVGQAYEDFSQLTDDDVRRLSQHLRA